MRAGRRRCPQGSARDPSGHFGVYSVAQGRRRPKLGRTRGHCPGGLRARTGSDRLLGRRRHRMNTTHLWIVVTGPDGSGKSTACAGCARCWTSAWARARWPKSRCGIAWPSKTGFRPRFAPSGGRALPGRIWTARAARSLFFTRSRVRSSWPSAKARAVCLLNGYWYKYAVSEIGYGVDPEFVLGAASGFARPAHVFCLDIDPATAWERRQSATRYEQGGGTRPGASERERFRRLSDQLAPGMEGIEAQTGLHWEHLSALRRPKKSPAEIRRGHAPALRKGDCVKLRADAVILNP